MIANCKANPKRLCRGVRPLREKEQQHPQGIEEFSLREYGSFYTAAKCGYNPFLYGENDETTFEAIVDWCEKH